MHSFLCFLLFLASACFPLIHGQTFHLGRCPQLKAKSDFDLSLFQGVWYEYAKNRRFYAINDMGLRCATDTFDVQLDDSVHMTRRGTHISVRRAVTEVGTGYLESPGKFLFDFTTLAPTFPTKVPLYVLDTDYDTFAVVWSCTENMRTNGQVTKILTRDPNPDAAIVRMAYEVLDANRISRSAFIRTPQTSCTYFDRNPKE